MCRDDIDLRHEVESLLEFHEDESAARSTASDVTGPPDRFAPGDVFAGRYRMITRLGSGGMGDVWRADDLVLGTPVALKLIHPGSPTGRSAILNEVRLGRQITHPAVCRVFDVDEANGQFFYSMELVRGEDLAKLLKRAGRLPVEKVVEIARQLCAGLAAAHAQGVLHRDLKPANVLIDDEGFIRITDFGIAVPVDESGSHSLIGTPGYMAPEQLIPGATLSERTDIYALGVVLYELLCGVHPYTRSSTPGHPTPLSDLVLVDPALEALVLRALSPDPRDRPESAAAMGQALKQLASSRHTGPLIAAPPPQRRWSWWMAAPLATVLLIAVWFLALKPGRAPGLSEQDLIMVADVENTTGDRVFDGTLKVALAVALEQSPFLRVFPEQRARETLRLMERSPDERLTAPIAREIAQRELLKAFLTGSIASLGSNYVLTLEAINAETGDVMAREQVQVAKKEDVLTALGGAASRMRETLGESLATIERFDVPLPRATTPSLDALHAYALALDQGRAIPRLEAIPHLRRAIELDPDFAMAHALLSGVYSNTGQTALAPEFARKAFELRDRVSERERFFISWRYYRDALQDADKSLELARSWAATYPREAYAFNALGIASNGVGQYDQARAALRTAIDLDPKFVPAYLNLADVLRATNQFAEAKGVVAEANSRGIEHISLRRTLYLIALIEGDSATAAKQLELALKAADPHPALDWEVRTAAFNGKVGSAHARFRSIINMAVQQGFNEWAARFALEDAEMHAVVGDCAEVPGEIETTLGLSRDNFTLARAARVLALCGKATEATALLTETTKRFADATLTHRVLMPVAAATSALRRGNPRLTLELLEPVRTYDHALVSEYWPEYLRAQSLLQLKDGREAAAIFQRILEHRGEAPDSMLYPLAYLGLARSAALTGDVPRARRAYTDFLALWKEADADLRPIEEARKELAELP